ncbi:MAG: response regulator [Acidobacteriota bacterium]
MDETLPHVLVVDDDEDFLALLALHLAARCRLTVVRNGEEALRAVAQSRPDLILLDVMMPRLSGWEVCRELKSNALYEDIPVIYVTAVGAKISGSLSHLTLADDILMKPFDLRELDRKMARFLTKKQV